MNMVIVVMVIMATAEEAFESQLIAHTHSQCSILSSPAAVDLLSRAKRTVRQWEFIEWIFSRANYAIYLIMRKNTGCRGALLCFALLCFLCLVRSESR